MREPKKILLTFNGNQDPFSKDNSYGPVLSLLKAGRNYDTIVLFHTPDKEEAAKSTSEIIHNKFGMGTTLIGLDIKDPTSYQQILKALRPAVRSMLEQEPIAIFEILIAPGTSQMHACWLLLAASGEIPATVIHKREERHVENGQDLVTIVDPLSIDFPRIRPNITPLEIPSISDERLKESLRQVNIIGSSPSILDAVRIAALAAGANVPVLIRGESGTGKELFARFIHLMSGKASGPFIPVNCAALPDSLAESELFGHVKGAFTGAIDNKIGLFEHANGGTLFLDEIGDMPLHLQAKVLRSLQDSEVRPVGSADSRKIALRIISATNVDISTAVRDKRFREDLYYRLNTVEIRLPPLRERANDIPAIASALLDRWNDDQQLTKKLNNEALRKLQGYSWPGNIRDLKNVVIRSAILSTSEVISGKEITLPIQGVEDCVLPALYEGFSLEAYKKNLHDRLIQRALEITSGNQSKAAKLLGITAQAVSQYLRKMDTH
jgi:DNA-binding NtrC family response regulator